MKCRAVRSHLSEYLDCELPHDVMGAVARHLETCADCAAVQRDMSRSSELLAALPRLQAPPIAQTLKDRLELEARSPGLQFLYRPALLARPLILPSLVPAMAVFVVILASVLFLDRSREPWVPTQAAARGEAWSPRTPLSGTESNPLFPSTGVAVPQVRARIAVPEPLLDSPGEESSLFFETVVARDGSVSAVTLIDGDSEQGRVLVDALRRERFEPVRLKGRPVAVSLYRLFSRMEVRPRTT
jgi:hypothetical protein